MQIHFTGRHMEVTEALRNVTTDKFEKLSRHFDHIQEARVTFGTEKLSQLVEASLSVPGTDIVASAENEDMYIAIDLLVKKLNKLLTKHKEKHTQYHRE